MQSHSSYERALVLGGGGSAGNAWLIGVMAGLSDEGLDVSRADVIIGTSAGATAAAQVTGRAPADLYTDILDAVIPPRAGAGGGVGAAAGTVVNHMDRTQRIIDDASDAVAMRRAMGAGAVDLAAAGEEDPSARWRATVAPRLPRQEWPAQHLLITAVDARTGEPVVFERGSGVDLVDAVAASTAGSFAYTIDDRQYLDGGYRTNAENADLASGCGRVLVLSPFGGRTRLPAEWKLDLATQIAELRAAGAVVETVFPDADSLTAFGDNMMDLSRRTPSARAGFVQGRAAAVELNEFWG